MKTDSLKSSVVTVAFLAFATFKAVAADLTHFDAPITIDPALIKSSNPAVESRIREFWEAAGDLRLTLQVLWSDGQVATFTDCDTSINAEYNEIRGATFGVKYETITNASDKYQVFLTLLPSGDYLVGVQYTVTTIHPVNRAPLQQLSGQIILGRISYSRPNVLRKVNTPDPDQIQFRINRSPMTGHTVARQIAMTVHEGIISDGRFVVTGTTTIGITVYTQPPTPVVIDDRLR